MEPANWTAILAVTQSNQSAGQPSCQSLNQTSQLDSHPGSRSIRPARESWRPVGRLKGGVWGGGSPPRKNQLTATAATATVSQELFPFGSTPGASRPGTKYPVWGIPHFDQNKHIKTRSEREKGLAWIGMYQHVDTTRHVQ